MVNLGSVTQTLHSVVQSLEHAFLGDQRGSKTLAAGSGETQSSAKILFDGLAKLDGLTLGTASTRDLDRLFENFDFNTSFLPMKLQPLDVKVGDWGMFNSVVGDTFSALDTDGLFDTVKRGPLLDFPQFASPFDSKAVQETISRLRARFDEPAPSAPPPSYQAATGVGCETKPDTSPSAPPPRYEAAASEEVGSVPLPPSYDIATSPDFDAFGPPPSYDVATRPDFGVKMSSPTQTAAPVTPSDNRAAEDPIYAASPPSYEAATRAGPGTFKPDTL